MRPELSSFLWSRCRARADFLGLGAIFGFIWEGIKWLAGKAADLAILLAAAAKQAGLQIWNAMKLLGRYAVKFADWIRRGAEYVYGSIIRPLAQALWGALEKVSAFLRRVLGPLIRIVKKVQDFLLVLWRDVLAPILSAIEAVRFVLQLLAKAGFEWAAAADAWLANIERKIIDAFRTLQGWVNRFADFLNRLLTPEGLLHPILLLLSLDPLRGRIVGLLTKDGWTQFHTDVQDSLLRQYPPNVHASMLAAFETGEVAKQPVADVIQAIAERILRERA